MDFKITITSTSSCFFKHVRKSKKQEIVVPWCTPPVMAVLQSIESNLILSLVGWVLRQGELWH